MSLFFGIDGGGTHGRITVIDESNCVLYKGDGECLNMHAANKTDVQKNLSLLINAMFSSLQAKPQDFSAGCFAGAGIATENEKQFFQDFFCDSLSFSCPLFLCNDSISALVGGLEKTEGFILISGTGSIAAALTQDGTMVRTGGWGHILGDEGSGYWIGCQGLIRGIHAAEGREKETSLSQCIKSFYSVDSYRDLFPFVYTSFNKANIARFAKIVFEQAVAGDSVSKEILDEAENHLVTLCAGVYKQIGDIPTKEMVFSGGILEHEPAFCENIKQKILRFIPEMNFAQRKNDPAFGACLLAKQHAGHS